MGNNLVDEIEKISHILAKNPHIKELKVKEHGRSLHLVCHDIDNKNNIPQHNDISIKNIAKQQVVNCNPQIQSETSVTDESEKHYVNSPMVGTFYISSSPGVDPFVNIGQHVKQGDVICIVEAMKMFNEIEADCEGIIKERLVDNGDAVEFGQKLFVIATE